MIMKEHLSVQNLFAAVKKGQLADFCALFAQKSGEEPRDGRGNTLLMVALKRQRWAAVDFLLEQGADVCAQNEDGASALLWSAYCGSVELCELLIAAGADVNTRTLRGFTPLMAAAVTDNLPVAKCLLQHGANAAETDARGVSAYLYALFHGSETVASCLQEQGAAVSAELAQRIVELRQQGVVRTRVCKNPFAFAFALPDMAMLRAYEELGVTYAEPELRALIPAAVKCGSTELVEWLFAKMPAAKSVAALSDMLEYALRDLNLPVADYVVEQGMLPAEVLHDICQKWVNDIVLSDSMDGVRWLMQHGLSTVKPFTFLSAMDIKNRLMVDTLLPLLRLRNYNPRHMVRRALQIGYTHVAEYILSKCEMPADVKAGMLEACMFDAVRDGSIEVMQWLLEHGASAADEELLDEALRYGTRDIVDFVLPLVKVENPARVISLAFEHGYMHVVQQVAERCGMDEEALHRAYNDALLEAAGDGRYDCVRWLLARGADVNTTDDKGRTPFNQALRCGILRQALSICQQGRYNRDVRRYRDILRLLLDHGATLQGIEKHAALPAPKMEPILLSCVRDFGTPNVPELIEDRALALDIFNRLPHTLTWI